MNPQRRMLARALLCATVLCAPAAHSQTYPSKPITFVSTFPPGGGSDIVTRLLAARLSANLGLQIPVDNRVGAAGTIGAASVARASPDGYTMMFGTAAALSVAPALYGNLSFDPVKSFTPVIEVARGYFVLLVNPSLPVKSATDLVEYAKRNPGRLNFGSSGQGSVHHLGGEMLKQATGIDMVHVPFKGTGPALPALAAGDIQVMFEGGSSWIPYAQAGRLRPIAVSGPRRFPVLPDVPTFTEQGIQGAELAFWWGIVMPAGTPRPIVDRMNAEFRRVLTDPELVASLRQQGAEASPGTPEGLARLIAEEQARWTQVVARAGVKVE